MHILLDHISAWMISGCVILMVVSTQFNAQRSSVEQSIAYGAKAQILQMADMMEQELLLIGEGTDDTIETVTENDAGETVEFTFHREDDGGSDIEVSYQLVETESIEIDDEETQLYRLDRYEGGVIDGGGSSTMSHFRITMLDASGTETASVASARLLRLAAVNAYAHGDTEDMFLYESYWGLTIRPMNLE
ncbi:MAG: hypothetical protein HOC28_06745 [Bacteroidetes Order II. Incertae sedis bacterium]|jgi:hypothetical protein|nr:hypothetical protein [Bacteroidetes Order II. bacterium]MBT4602816.1 hypothetical protein [Bacteroidetes Order II. bacterium]MBT5248673.1 hypothetical protein [Bacteroidetes Order II. bacterium]MBT6425497.1 hypothetical protein [Bacteroidetes Order II. bacterium]MBT6597687.1 hypothetical protein [Bacteroidetes Order II. bacterium]